MTENGSLSHCANWYIIKKIGYKEIIIPRQRRAIKQNRDLLYYAPGKLRERAYSQKKKIMGNSYKS